MTHTDTPTTSITHDSLTALSMVGRRVSLPGTHRIGTVLTVEGPNWTAVQGQDGTATVVYHQGLNRRYDVPVAEVKWDRPLMGLTLLGVDMCDLSRGVTLVKPSDH